MEQGQLRQRLQILDQLDTWFPDANPTARIHLDADLYERAESLRARLDAANAAFYHSVRARIQHGERPDLLLQCAHSSEAPPPPGLGYDFLDEFVAGVLQLDEPSEAPGQPDPEMVFYQPTPARHIFHLFRLAHLSVSDTLIDLGAGLGHVSILTSICTGARCVGIEVEEAYVASARRCAENLNLDRVRFVREDVRTADFSAGTIFYLYTPFRGAILDAVLGRLRRETENRSIRIATFGPCTEMVARESWLTASMPADPERVALFSSRS